jgi:hypothetical protein
MAQPVNIEDVIEWIREVDDETLDVVLDALQRRHDALHEERADLAVLGATVVLQDLRPTYLDGLEGVIEEIDEDEGCVSVRLNRVSTGRLRFVGQGDFHLGSELNFLLTGVPASCCYTAASRRSA